VAGLAGALVAWVGLNRANSYLGVPAAVAAVVGLGVSVYGLRGEAGDGAQPGVGRRVRQGARASKGSRVVQIGGRAGARPAPTEADPADIEQRARAVDRSRIEQVGGDAVGQRDAAQE
jgi:hypothetical protein